MENAITPLQDRIIRIGKIQARYWVEGNSGSPVILIHGLGGYVETWQPNIMALAQAHRVYAVDMPGSGKSESPADGKYDMQSFAQFVHDFMSALDLEHASLVGHSLGGAIALQFAFDFPRMVDRLALLSSAGLGPEVGFQLRLVSLPFLGEFLTKPSLKASRWHLEGIVFDKSLITEDQVQVDYALCARPGIQQIMLKTVRPLIDLRGQKRSFYGPILEKLPTLSQPTLVIWGREDPICPVRQTEAAQRIPNAQCKVYEQCGHYPQYEHCQEVTQALLDFLG